MNLATFGTRAERHPLDHVAEHPRSLQTLPGTGQGTSKPLEVPVIS